MKENRSLLILRHAQSAWQEPGGADIERTLTLSGVADARRIGVFLRVSALAPDFIMTSSALRALRTTELVAETSGYGEAIREEKSLYGGGVGEAMRLLRSLPDHCRIPLLVGHNPTVEALVSELISGGHSTARASVQMAAGALVCLRVALDQWVSLKPDSCELQWMIHPGLLETMITHHDTFRLFESS